MRFEAAQMQALNWNDLRYLLAAQRGGSLIAAGRLLKVDDTTVARRLKALEAALGGRLTRREADGRLGLTELGEAAARRAEQVESEIALLAEETKADGDACAGTVRLTSVPILIDRLLTPSAGALLGRHPALALELVPDSRDFSLARREADMALRLARPRAGGTRVRTRRLAVLGYAVYAPSGASAAEALPWIGYSEAMAHLPQARWMAQAGEGQRVSGLRVEDAETALEAVAAGLGRTVLPDLVAARDPRLKRVGDTALSRELWVAVHADLAGLPRIAAVIGWIEELLAKIDRD